MTPTISKELREQIELHALQLKLDYAEDSMSYEATAKAEGIEIGYIAGATAYAHYKERFEQAKKVLEKLLKYGYDDAAWTTVDGDFAAVEARKFLASWKEEGKEVNNA